MNGFFFEFVKSGPVIVGNQHIAKGISISETMPLLEY